MTQESTCVWNKLLKSGSALNTGALPQKLSGGACFALVWISIEAVGPFQCWVTLFSVTIMVKHSPAAEGHLGYF